MVLPLMVLYNSVSRALLLPVPDVYEARVAAQPMIVGVLLDVTPVMTSLPLLGAVPEPVTPFVYIGVLVIELADVGALALAVSVLMS